MSVRLSPLVMAAAFVVAVTGGAGAAGLKQIATITMPGEPLDSFDISYVDQKTHRLYIADRSNKAIDILDTRTNKYIGRVAGFKGFVKSNDDAGPNGVVTANEGTEAWAGDGDSTVKVIDLKGGKIVDTISTGGKNRADEVAYDPKDQVFIVANADDKPPFLTLISTKQGHKILAKIALPQATDGIEQSEYYAPTGMFYTDIPELDKDKTKGALAEINPRTGAIVKMHPLDSCIPHGLSVGKGSLMFVGCNAGNARSGLPARLAVFDAKADKVVAYISGFGRSDEAAADPGVGMYYAAGADPSGNFALGVIDAKTNMVAQTIPTSNGVHSVAVDRTNHHVYVPTTKTNGSCGGCILVFAPR